VFQILVVGLNPGVRNEKSHCMRIGKRRKDTPANQGTSCCGDRRNNDQADNSGKKVIFPVWTWVFFCHWI
jgi:hypothetical protein